MFRRTEPTDCTIVWEGRDLPAREGESLAVALLAAGITSFRETPVTGAARGPLCLMGACFDCLVEVAGAQNMQACLVPVTPGLVAGIQHGARSFEEDAA
ncbi:(2Fe-2S)-binding protein [Falsiroseomonas sp.]|uniref:(2Fe-2S)-binding protein n=1 Tax=Falsiroseomonas sp. TaxID=2870721 RepID=UPI002727C173|nr:(2Fe-2S)-binding protein [Falsiroseomonas sp.]MDO9498892.1 (2Fe-2S)-binding protein [Falsiroseomonas sp.]